MGEMGKTEKKRGGGVAENGRKMRGNGAEWENSGHSIRDVGSGGLWRDVVEDNGGEWEENGRKMGQNTHFSQFHFPQFPGGPL